MAQILFYADTHSLAAYLGGAALLEPSLAEVTCEALSLRPAKEKESEPLTGLFFSEAALNLPMPAEEITGTRLEQATLDRKKGELTVKVGRRKERYVLDGDQHGRRELAQVLPPLPWKGAPPEAQEVIYLCPEGAPFARLVTQHLELGRNELRYVPIGDGRMLLEVLQPSWFLLERWLQEDANEVTVFRRLQSPLGPRRIYVEWGYEHALETWLVDPADDRLLLLVDREGRHRTLQLGDLTDVTEVLDLDPAQFSTVHLEPGDQPERVNVRMRLEGRTAPDDPQLWLVPVAQRHRLEEMLVDIPEEALPNLLVACVGASGEDPLFVVREVLSGRHPHLLPMAERIYAPLTGVPGLFLPCHQAIRPNLNAERYARAFAVRPGELTILDDLGDGEITLTKIPESAFRPVDRIIDFVIDGHSQEVEEVMLAAPFDLGPFAEEDLVPKAVKARRPKPEPRPEPPTKAEKEPAPRRKPSLMDKLLKPFRAPTTQTQKEAPTPAQRSERQLEIEKVQRALVLDGASAPLWLDLSRLLFEDAQDEEALRAAECAIWDMEPEPAGETLAALEATLGPPGDGAPRDTLELYRRAFAYREQAGRVSGDVASYRQATEAIYQALREHEDRLRKRSRWLLWRSVLRETGDAIEVERQREAILADLVVRGIEEREVPSFVRHLLLENYGQKAATGSGASAALAFLERAEEFVQVLKHPAYQAAALAQVAWAFAELGQGERAVELADRAERLAQSKEGAPPHDAWRARAVARVGAVLERVRGRDQGRAQLEGALAQISRQLPREPAKKQNQEHVDARKAFVSWLNSAADAWTSGDRQGDPLLERAVKLLESRPPNVQSQVINDAPGPLGRLGLSKAVSDLAWKLLRPEELKRANDCVLEYQHPQDAYRVHVQNVIESLEHYRDGAEVSEEESRTILGLLRSHPMLIDEFTISSIRIALKGVRGSPWDSIEELVTELRQRNLEYEAQLVRIAGLWALADKRERQQGADLLEQVLEESWNLPTNQKKPPHRVLTRLVALVPAFGMRDRGLRVLHGVNERTQTRASEGVYFRNELLLSTALAGSQLGDSRAAFDLISETARMAIQEFENASRGGRASGPSWLLFETLDECVRGTADLGETRRGLELVSAVADAARAALTQASEGPGRGAAEGPYFYCRTLIRCGAAALALGDAEGATAHFRSAFDHFKTLNNWDLTEILQEAAVVAGRLEGARRYELAGEVVDHAREPVRSGTQDRFAMELVAQIAGDMVRGESAFASALKRWKGSEERSIRDRVAHEQVADGA